MHGRHPHPLQQAGTWGKKKKEGTQKILTCEGGPEGFFNHW